MGSNTENGVFGRQPFKKKGFSSSDIFCTLLKLYIVATRKGKVLKNIEIEAKFYDFFFINSKKPFLFVPPFPKKKSFLGRLKSNFIIYFKI